MSREERRAYRRMTRNQDPYAPPPMSAAARARAEAQQRARRPSPQPGATGGGLLSGRLAWWLVGGALVAFLLGLSLAWPSGPSVALLAGAGAGIGWIILIVAFAWWRRRQRRDVSQRARGPAGR
jgi:hypothetical protein